MSVSRKAAFAATSLSAAMVLAMAANAAHAAPTPAPKPVACPAAPGIDNAQIKIGVITPRTGSSANTFAGFYEAAKLRFDQQNAAGGINGRKIVVTSYDDQASGAVQSGVASKAIDQDGNFGLLEATTADTMFPFLKLKNVPVIGLTNLPAQTTDRNAFGATGAFAPTIGGLGAAQKLKDLGVTSVIVINHNSPGANAAGAAFIATAPLVGLTNAPRIADAPIGAYDATSTALKTKNSGADGANLILLVDGSVSVLQAFKQQNVSMKGVLVAGLSDPATVAKTPAALEGAIGSTFGTVAPGVPGRPGLRTYVNGMKAAGLNPYGSSTPNGFVSADTMIKGLKLAGRCPTRQGVIDQLRNQTNITGGGLLPIPISYKPGLTPDGDPAQCGWYMTAKGGQLIPDLKPTCGPLIDVATGKIVKPAPKL
ncbi:MAG: ABC transporter substrate-binding protein [Actinomycetota bacterium]|nr:ABC transporter substrate-binding protein [Actinomycetota bacterium]